MIVTPTRKMSIPELINCIINDLNHLNNKFSAIAHTHAKIINTIMEITGKKNKEIAKFHKTLKDEIKKDKEKTNDSKRNTGSSLPREEQGKNDQEVQNPQGSGENAPGNNGKPE